MMPDQTFPDPFPPQLENALRQVWNEHASLVQKFQLEYRPGGVVLTSWFVMIHSAETQPNAQELVAAVRQLEADVEARSGLDVTLMLAVSPPQSGRRTA